MKEIIWKIDQIFIEEHYYTKITTNKSMTMPEKKTKTLHEQLNNHRV